MPVRKAPVADPARPTASELRRWRAGYRRTEQRQRELLAAGNVNLRHAADLALDLLDVGTGELPGPRSQIRERDIAAVRAVWRRLRAPFVVRR